MTLHDAQKALDSAALRVRPTYRLAYHLMPRANWMNDPNGLIFFQGYYHAFYQHHPYDENWGPMHWGHAISYDLVHWKHYPIALAPGDVCDRDGCFSGSSVDNNGELTLIYTGHHYIDKAKNIFFENQNIAISKDGIHFEKYAKNPVIATPPCDSSQHFRDPKVWKRGEKWYMILGNSTKQDIPRVLLYESNDLREWSFRGVLLSGCEGMGYMWECPDFFELHEGEGIKHVLLFSPQGMKPKGDRFKNLYQTGYFVGTYDYETNAFLHGGFEELDRGYDFYATQTLLDSKNRRIVMAWMDMWESNMPTKKHGWCGAMTLPRVLRLKGGKIFQEPVSELESLRVRQDHNQCKLTLLEPRSFSLASQALEIVICIKNDGFECAWLCFRNEKEHFDLSIEGEDVKLDCSMVGKNGVRRAKLEKSNNIFLHIFLDRSSVEIFINHGELTMTSRIYPTLPLQDLLLHFKGSRLEIEKLETFELKDLRL